MILVDTSVWVDHLRHRNARLADMLAADRVAAHPMVMGELACGRLRNRDEVLSLLAALPQTEPVDHHEALAFLHAHRLAGTGLGWTDLHLLASARLGGVPIWTLDRALRRAAQRLRLASEGAR